MRSFANAGTPFYMSPEQLAAESHAIDERSDIYSLGKVLQEMLGGSLPMKVTAQDVLPSGLPAELVSICRKATALDPHERYQQVVELADDLDRFMSKRTPRLTWRRVKIASTLVVACLLMSLWAWRYRARDLERKSAEQAVEALLQADPSTLPSRASATTLRSPLAKSLLRSAVQSEEADRKLRARIGLMHIDESQVSIVAEEMLNGKVDMVLPLVNLLLPYRTQLTPVMWQTLQSDSQASRTLNAAAYLAVAAGSDERWHDEDLVEKLLHALVGESLADLQLRVDSLIQIRELLKAAFRRAIALKVQQFTADERQRILSVWELLVQHDLRGSIELMLAGPPNVYSAMLNRLDETDPNTVDILREISLIGLPTFADNNSHADLQYRHLAAMALLKLGREEDYWPLWSCQSNPTQMALQISMIGYEPLNRKRLINRLRQTNGFAAVQSLPSDLGHRLSDSALCERRNLLLGLLSANAKRPSENEICSVDELAKLYQRDADPCVHSMAKQLLLRAGLALPELDKSTRDIAHNGTWFVNSLDETMVIVPPTPATKYRYAIAGCELQRQHFEQFLDETGHSWDGLRLTMNADTQADDAQRAQVGLSWYDCAAFCNWLSRREGLTECYLPNSAGRYAEGMSLRADILEQDGYRLPTGLEWENAGRAGVPTELYFGNAAFTVRDYVWSMTSTRGIPQPVGKLRPNNLGLFDIHGNASEWTMDIPESPELVLEVRDDQLRLHRGGSFQSRQHSDVFFSVRNCSVVHERSSGTGLRVARTLR